jgi:chromosome segregation ATPase
MGNLAQYKNGILIVLTIITLVVGSYYLGGARHDDSKYQQQIAQWKDIATTALQRNATVNHEVDSLNKEIVPLQKQSQQQDVIIAHLQARADSIRKARPEVTQVLATLPDTCAPAKVVIMSQQAEIATLRTEVDTANARDSTRLLENSILIQGVKMLQSQNDSLVNIIKMVPIYHEPKILGIIPQPSRTFSFIGGILIGVGASIVLSHQVR